MAKFCGYCGSQITGREKICQDCGKPTGGVRTQYQSKKGCRIGCLISIVCLIGFIVLIFIAAFAILGVAANDDYYDLGNDQIPSIKHVIGKRPISTIETSSSGSLTNLKLEYKIKESPFSDLVDYTDYLRENEGFFFMKGFSSDVVDARMVKESVDSGYIIVLDIVFYDNGYILCFSKHEGVASQQ
jgi:hypothetical protein